MESKICVICKQTKPFQHFQQIIIRKTYAPGTDRDGLEYFAKETKTCLGCRDVANATTKRYRRRKYPDPPDNKDAPLPLKIKCEILL